VLTNVLLTSVSQLNTQAGDRTETSQMAAIPAGALDHLADILESNFGRLVTVANMQKSVHQISALQPFIFSFTFPIFSFTTCIIICIS
jgi:hypothetical protein